MSKLIKGTSEQRAVRGFVLVKMNYSQKLTAKIESSFMTMFFKPYMCNEYNLTLNYPCQRWNSISNVPIHFIMLKISVDHNKMMLGEGLSIDLTFVPFCQYSY